MVGVLSVPSGRSRLKAWPGPAEGPVHDAGEEELSISQEAGGPESPF